MVTSVVGAAVLVVMISVLVGMVTSVVDSSVVVSVVEGEETAVDNGDVMVVIIVVA